MPKLMTDKKAMYMLTIKNSPWAQLTMRMTPKARDRPTAMVEYTPPTMIPSIRVWKNSDKVIYRNPPFSN